MANNQHYSIRTILKLLPLWIAILIPPIIERTVLVSSTYYFLYIGLASAFVLYGLTMKDLRGKGYGRSEFELGYARSLSSSAALIGGAAVRYNADGRRLERVGITYLLHKTESGWKFATVILHDPNPAA